VWVSSRAELVSASAFVYAYFLSTRVLNLAFDLRKLPAAMLC